MSYRNRKSAVSQATQDAEPQPQSSTQRQESEINDASDAEVEPNKQGIPEADVQLMVKNFVRLALASELTRTPIKREDVAKKVFVNDHKRCFKLIFDRTQARLKDTLGMKLVELPAKDRTKNMTMTQQRKAAHIQASTNTNHAASKSNRSYILQNLLPPKYKQISQRQHMESERNYNAVLMIIMIIVVMSDDQSCSENRVISALERLGWSPDTPAGLINDVIGRMTKQAYLERVKDDQNPDGSYNLFIGPRGKLETLRNREELFSVISTIYGHSSDDATAREHLKQVIDNTFDGDDELIESEDEADDTMVFTQMTQPTPQTTNGKQRDSEPSSKRKKTGRRRRTDQDDEDE